MYHLHLPEVPSNPKCAVKHHNSFQQESGIMFRRDVQSKAVVQSMLTLLTFRARPGASAPPDAMAQHSSRPARDALRDAW
jgi:hypothetical protein